MLSIQNLHMVNLIVNFSKCKEIIKVQNESVKSRRETWQETSGSLMRLIKLCVHN